MQEEEEKELAVIFLQQVLRGRAVQNMVSLLLSLVSLPFSVCVSHVLVRAHEQTHTQTHTRAHTHTHNDTHTQTHTQ